MENSQRQLAELAIKRLVKRHNNRKPITLDVAQEKEDARRIRRDKKNIISRYKIK